MIIPDRLLVGVPRALDAPSPDLPLYEVGEDFSDLPDPASVRSATGKDAILTMVAWHVLTHRRSDRSKKGAYGEIQRNEDRPILFLVLGIRRSLRSGYRMSVHNGTGSDAFSA